MDFMRFSTRETKNETHRERKMNRYENEYTQAHALNFCENVDGCKVSAQLISIFSVSVFCNMLWTMALASFFGISLHVVVAMRDVIS